MKTTVPLFGIHIDSPFAKALAADTIQDLPRELELTIIVKERNIFTD